MGKTKDLGHLAHIAQYDGSNNVTLPAGLKINGADDVMTNAAMTSALGGYVPASRVITINGTAYDLSSDRSWNIAAGLTSFNTRTGAVTLSSGDVTGALGYTPVTNARTITINGTSYDLSADRSWTVSGSDSTKLPLSGGTLTGTVTFAGSTRFPDTNGTIDSLWGIYAWDGQLQFTKRNTSTDAYIGTAMFIDYGGMYVQSDYSFRAPIYYDSQNTAYYIDPNSNSNLATLTLNGNDNQLNINAPTNGAAGIFYRENGSNKWETYHYQGKFRFYNYNTNQEELSLDNSGGFLTARTSIRAPIFYDSNDTSYYLDPNSTSRLYLVDSPQGYISNGNPWGTANSAFFPNGITTAGGTNWVYGLTYLGNAPGNGAGVSIASNGSSYFRSNNSSGTWGYAGLFVDRNYSSNNYIPWSFENEYGTHSWGIVARFHVQQANADRPSIQFSAAGGNDRWSLGYCTGSDWHFRITQNQGFRTDNSTNDGWGTERFRINTDGNTYAAIGGTLYANGSAVITSANIGSQSVSYAGTSGNTNSVSSATGGSYTWTNVQYFLTNNGGQAVNNSNSAILQVYSTGNNSAFMSFHKAGHFAINMGLDDDNVFRIGGWSAGANRLQLDMSGNLTIAGTGYFGITGAAGSLAYNASANNIYNSGWYRNYGDTGLYNQDVGAHFRRTSASHGTWEVFGYTKGGYVGVDIVDQGGYHNNLMYEYGTGGCYQENGGGWHYYYARGNDCIGLSGSDTYDWVRACTNGKHRFTNDTWCDATAWAYTFSNISDGRLKENIVTVDSALDKVLQLRGVYYSWIIDTESKTHIGLIAQETAEVCPEVVNYHEETDTYSVNYSELGGLFVESTKELNQKLMDANARIELLESKINQLLNA